MKKLKRIFLMSGLIVVGLGSIGPAATALLATSPKESVILISAEEALDTACICQDDYIIDSMVKIIEEYPHLRAAHEAAQNLIKNEALLRDDQRAKILQYLDLQVWDMTDIRKRIRRLKWQRIWYGAGGFSVGAFTGAFLIYRIIKP